MKSRSLIILLLALLIVCPTVQLQAETTATVGDEVTNFDSEAECRLACSDCCDPLWTITASAMFLKRSDPDSLILMQDTTDPTRNLNGNDFDFDFRPGWAVSLGRRLNDDWGVEVRYFGVDSWNARVTAVTNSTLLDPLQINTSPLVFLPNVQTINATYGSQLHNAEMNLRRGWNDWLTMLGGFRYVELDDHLRANMITPLPTFTYDTATRNRMYGFQLGADAFLGCWKGLELDATIKAGIFQNSGAQTSVLDTTMVTVASRGNSDRTAFVGEFGLAGVYGLTDNLSARASYNLLWVDGAVLASDQFPATNFNTGTGIDSSGHVFYHGVLVGLEYRR